jgi:hypothetical protein
LWYNVHMKQYIIRKYVMAKNVKDALKKEKTIKADEAWIDPEWQKVNPQIAPMGFRVKKR